MPRYANEIIIGLINLTDLFGVSRFADIRDTQQGKLEERLPFFSFTFPSWFKSKFPEAFNNFKENARRLTTPFDINKTLRNILHFDGGGIGTLDERAISLFKKVLNHWYSFFK